MKVYVWKDEAYPVYGIDKPPTEWKKTVEIPDDLYNRYITINKAYSSMQDELAKYSCE